MISGSCKTVKDESGVIQALDFDKLPFIPKRVVFIRFSESKVRGNHSYKHRQVILCLRGRVRVFYGEPGALDVIDVVENEWISPDPGSFVRISAYCDCATVAVYSEKPYNKQDYTE